MQVSIPSIQVCISNCDSMARGVGSFRHSLNPFYSGLYFQQNNGFLNDGAADQLLSQSLLFRSVFPTLYLSDSRIYNESLGLNPFYSGLYFQLRLGHYFKKFKGGSQSLLFRSVFPTQPRSKKLLGWGAVSIPSIQVCISN